MPRYPKLRRKDLLKPDEFVSLTNRVAEFATENAAAATTAVVLFFLLVVGFAGVSLWKKMQRSAANVAFTSARGLFLAEKFQPAEEAFARIAAKYSRTPYSAFALLYGGDAALAAADYEKAADFYRRFLDAGPPSEYLRQEALLRLARAQERGGDLARARATYEEAYGLPGPFTPDALFGQARVAEASADREAAERSYRQFIDSYPTSDLALLARARLAALSGSADGAARPAAASP